ncbi:MAG TPA: DNA glycosylase [Candidatus Nanoarchaeia archaeon]|nr:DNA glycosylase [Candidatus Nanoarchaeia archaeon]
MRLAVSTFDLANTITSGQFFRFQKVGEWYYCHERDKCFKVCQQESALFFEGVDESHITRLFGLTKQQEKSIELLKQDPTLIPLINKYKGLRVMQRDPWETLVSFQCSIMSNIPKIRKNMELLAQAFGKEIVVDGQKRHAFPNPGDINDLSKIKACATGFRARYIHAANRMVTDAFFEKLKKKKYEEAHEKLMDLPGVAEKVADCICLFALGKTEAFPVDVWIERVMQELYFNEERVKHDHMREFAKERWGKNAGYAQQYLYHWVRNKQKGID